MERFCPVVVYKLDTPVVYNKGTQYEKSCDTFLHCYACTDKQAEELAAELNKTAVDRHYYVSHQEAMGD